MNIKEIEVIAVKDKYDVLKASDLLETMGIHIFASAETKSRFIETGDTIKDSFLMRDSHGWRVQSHYIAEGTSIEELEKIVSGAGPQMLLKQIIEDIDKEMDAAKVQFGKLEDKINELKALI